MAKIHQEVTFGAAPGAVWKTLVDAKKFGEATGQPASGGGGEGAAFSAFGGHVTGRNVEVVESKRLVQAWRAKTWPEGQWSIVRFELSPGPGGTKLVFDHEGFPEAEQEHLAAGWKSMYWEKIEAAVKAS
ncbi:MAG TPA: SRPBCC domain-containing protein [Polyangiaceae bacterium]|jgi:activator of HSP90 ATPase